MSGDILVKIGVRMSSHECLRFDISGKYVSVEDTENAFFPTGIKSHVVFMFVCFLSRETASV